MATSRDFMKSTIKKGSDEVFDESEETFDICCSLCSENNKFSEATKFCKNCITNLCDKCLSEHNRFSFTRSHVIIDATKNLFTELNVPRDIPTCATHPGNEITKFCRQHNVICCMRCIAVKHRNCKGISEITEAARNVKKNPYYKTNYDDLEKVLFSLKDLKDERNKRFAEFNTTMDSTVNDVDNYREELLAKINQIAEETNRRLSIHRRAREKREHDDLSYIEAVISFTTEMLKTLSSEDELKVFTSLSSTTTVLEESKQLLVEMTEGAEDGETEFRMDRTILETLSHCQTFLLEGARRITRKTDHVLNKTETLVKPEVLVKPHVSIEERVHAETFDDGNVEKPPKKIILSNLPSGVHEDFIELFLINKRKLNAGNVVSVELDEEDQSAIVEFEEHESVDIVLRHRPIEMMGKIIDVEVYNPKPVRLCTVKVTGPESFICELDEETLEMYFESERALGDKVVDLKIQDGVAFVTFESEDVALRVAKKSDHVIKRKKIEVQLFIPDTEKKTKRGRKVSSKEEVEEQQFPATIKVKGVKNVKSRDTVEFYLENQKRSGGGLIEEIKADEEDEDVIYVTYESVEVAKRVAERDHIVKGVDLKVSLYTPPKPPPSYPNKVLIKGLNVTTTEDGLFNFIKAKSEYTPKPGSLVCHSEEDGVVMITLEEEPDFEKLGNICSKNKLEGANLKMLPVPISSCILVSNLAQGVTKDTVEYYFENKRKSGGGAVKYVQMNDDDTCFVYFENYEDVDRVLKRRHELGNESLEVKRYLQCLRRPE